MKLKIIVVANKIDRPDARISEILNKTFDLFIELGADEEAAYFPVVYAAGKMGRAGLEPSLETMGDISPLFDSILEHIPAPSGEASEPLQMLITTISGDSYKGRVATGRIYNGILRQGQPVAYINREGAIKQVTLSSVMTFDGLERVDTKEAVAGDIVAIAGVPEITIGETIAQADNPIPLPLLTIEEPTVAMTISPNTSPFAGKEGTYCTSRQIKERLVRELETDVALRVVEVKPSTWEVSGRGELHLAILIERMRREGYEFQVSRPRAIEKQENGVTVVPYERLFIEVPSEHQGVVMESLGLRHGELQRMNIRENLVDLEYLIPTRGLFGFRSEFITSTRGLGIMNTIFDSFRPDPGNWKDRARGSLVAHETGTTHLYGLVQIQDRGTLFVGPGISVYKGQVVGRNSREDDLRINVCKMKQLSNMRSKGEGTMEHFNTPQEMNLEDSLEYIADDELVEVTPQSVRIRKVVLDPIEERRRLRGL